MHVDFTQLADSPMQAQPLPQPLLEHLLAELARERGAEIRRGQEVVGLSQDDATVTADVRGPDGQHQVTAGYLVGCDGAPSRVRDMAGIPFPGTTYPEVHRLAQVTVPESVTVLENRDLDVAGVGRIAFGFTRTERGEFAQGSTDPALLGLFTSEEESVDYDDDEPMTLTELRDSIRRVLGADLPLGEPTRLTRFTFHARQAERYRDGRILLAGDAAHLFPAPGVALNAGLIDGVNLAWKLAAAVHGWAPAGLLDTYHDERHLAGERTLLHTRAQVALRRGHDPAAVALRELFQELLARRASRSAASRPSWQAPTSATRCPATSDTRWPAPSHPTSPCTPTRARPASRHSCATRSPSSSTSPTVQTLREIAHGWRDRVDVHTAETDDRPADALLIRPDAHIAWAADVDEPTDTAVAALREALSCWFGESGRHPSDAAVHDEGSRIIGGAQASAVT